MSPGNKAIEAMIRAAGPYRTPAKREAPPRRPRNWQAIRWYSLLSCLLAMAVASMAYHSCTYVPYTTAEAEASAVSWLARRNITGSTECYDYSPGVARCDVMTSGVAPFVLECNRMNGCRLEVRK